MLFLVLLSAVGICAVELPRLVSNRRWKDLIVFSAFVLASVILGITLVLRIAVPNPIKFIEAMYKPFTDAFFWQRIEGRDDQWENNPEYRFVKPSGCLSTAG